ncbi:MAG: ribosome biogenesis GTP-binding protein YsxC [Candidatus Vogelbacteria bacterium]|nr:ribosome biogenesis GTP-binding protein YsxC [Candidatus Vogelbacteria bacterium]
MKIKSAKFIKGVRGTHTLLENGIPQVAFIGRSNVGKSSTINALTNQKGLARTSSFPGRTQEINIFLINESFYLIDLPGYGFAKAPLELREKILKLIRWYLIDSGVVQKKIVLIIDASVGATDSDIEMLGILEKENKNVVVVANKFDKIKSSERIKQLKKIQDVFIDHKVIPFSAEKKIGLDELIDEVLR